MLYVLIQAEHPKTGARWRKCYPVPGCSRGVGIEIGVLWDIQGKVCGAENVGKQQDTAIGEGAGGTNISVMGTSGHNASHLSSCLQEACFFHRNIL